MVVGKKHHFSMENAKNVHQPKLYIPSTINKKQKSNFGIENGLVSNRLAYI